MLILLFDGITGLSSGKTMLPTLNKDEFKRVCFQISNTLKFNIENFDFELVGKSFYYTKIKFNHDTIFILVNAYYPIIAFASEINPFNNIYLDNARLNSEFSKFYRVLSVSELKSPIDNEERKYLNHEELKQLEYYNPNCLAEVIFNYWD